MIRDVAFHRRTLAGYVHWKTDRSKKVCWESARLPVCSPSTWTQGNYHARMIDQFDALVADRGYSVEAGRHPADGASGAGEDAGCTDGGRRQTTGSQRNACRPGCRCARRRETPEPGMAATNSVADRTGNVSAGTSVFAMVVLEKELAKRIHEEIDMVTTPTGNLVAMVHCNNCTSDLNAWVSLFKEFAEAFGVEVDMNKLFGTLYNKALEGDDDCGGLLAYNYFSGEHITGFEEGRPLFVRMPESRFNLANFMRVHLFTALGALKTGLDILLKDEGVKLDKILGHGGLFKNKRRGTEDYGRGDQCAGICDGDCRRRRSLGNCPFGILYDPQRGGRNAG